MNSHSTTAQLSRRVRPRKALAIWVFDACAIVLVSLVILMVNEIRRQPRDAAAN